MLLCVWRALTDTLSSSEISSGIGNHEAPWGRQHQAITASFPPHLCAASKSSLTLFDGSDGKAFDLQGLPHLLKCYFLRRPLWVSHIWVLSLFFGTCLVRGGDGASGLEALSPMGQSQERQSGGGGAGGRLAPGSPEPEIHRTEPEMGARHLPGRVLHPSSGHLHPGPKPRCTGDSGSDWGQLTATAGGAGTAFLPETIGGLPPRFHLGIMGLDTKKAGVDPSRRMLGLLTHRVVVSSFQKSLGESAMHDTQMVAILSEQSLIFKYLLMFNV